MTIALTLAEARVRVARHLLDDPNNVRWEAAASPSELDLALRFGVSECMTMFASKGGLKFAEEYAATSTSAGVVDMASKDPLVIHAVMLLQDSVYEPVEQIEHWERETDDDTARTMRVVHTPQPPFPTTAGHPLVGDGSTAKKTWPTFDDWVCHRAALRLIPKDGIYPPGLQANEAALAASVLGLASTPGAVAFDIDRRRQPDLAWSYLGQTLQLSKRRWRW
jgi:hypothetical protein